jgi:rSAM/selenodomain-associated transferase 1
MMPPRHHLVVLARVPRYGSAKRRLAASVGAAEARRAYLAMISSVLRTASQAPFWTTRVAVTPDDGVAARCWHWCDVRAAQRAGDLGARMARALAENSGTGSTIVIGADIPEMTRANIRGAFRLLRANDVVFGPAADGGYWLVGVRQGLPPQTINHLFRDVRWSTSHALEDTRRNVRPGLRIAFAATMRDIDTSSDLAAWRRAGGA